MTNTNLLKVLSVIITLAMLVTVVPLEVFAVNDDEPSADIMPEEEISYGDVSDEDISDGESDISEIPEDAEPYVLGEAEELRESDSKQFRMSDGSYTIISYASDVHYEENGEWKEIDNTLLFREDGIVNTASDVEYTFTSDSHSLPGVTAELGEYQVGFTGVLEGDRPDVSDGRQTSSEETGNAGGGSESSEIISDGITDSEETTEDKEAEEEANNPSGNAYISENSIENLQANVETAQPEFRLEIVNPSSEIATFAAESEEAGEVHPKLEEFSSIDTLASAVKYNEVNGKDSYFYELQGRNLKESVVVNAPREEYTYYFVLNLDGLTAVLTETGEISLCDAHKEIFVMPAPYMQDANGAYSDAAAYTLSEASEEGYTLTLTADAEWINSPEREFPVVIDPSIFVSNSNENGTDITAECMTVGTANIDNDYFAVGRDEDTDIYSFVKVNTLPTIPYNAKFCKAWIGLRVAGYNPEGFNDFDLYAQEALDNWRTQFTGTANNNRIVDYMTIKEGSLSGLIQIEVTQQAKNWYEDTSTNKGIVLYAKQTNGQPLNNSCKAELFFPRYKEIDGKIAMPFFAVNYRNIQGIESYYSNQSFSAGRAGTAYVSDYTGALTLVHTDVSDGYTLSHVHNSKYSDHVFTNDNIFHTVDYSSMIIGVGWKLSAQESVVTQNITNYDGTQIEYAIYTDEDGTEHYFHNSASEEFKDEDGLGLTLTRNSAAHTFTMRDDKGNEKLFVYGYLTQIKDTNGNITAFIYNNASFSASGTGWYPNASGNKLTKIVQKNDSKTAYTVASLGYTGNRLTSITDRYGNVTEYAVGENGYQLNVITESDGTELTYGYGGGNLKMSRAYDSESRNGLLFEYSAKKANIMKISVYGKDASNQEIVSRIYYFNMGADGHTKVRDCGKDNAAYTSDDIIGHYLFDDYGRTVSYAAIDQSGNTLSASGGVYQPHEVGKETSKKNNRLLSEGSSGAVGQNMLLDGDGESDGTWGGNKTVGGFYSHGKSQKYKKSGQSSILVNLEQSDKSAAASQTVNFTTGGYYNITAYVKSSYMIHTGASDSGAYLNVDGEGVTVERRDVLNDTTDENANDGWQILTTVVRIPSPGEYTCQLKLNKCRGTVYFDEIRLTDGKYVSSFNLIENGNFDHSFDGESVVGGSIGETTSYNGIWGRSLYLQGNPQINSLYSKDLPISITAEEAQNTTFLLSGWAYARSLPITQDNRTFQLTAEIHYVGGENQYVTVRFNSDIVEDWQYACTPVVPNKNKAIEKITVHCSFKKNSGFAFFDDLSLTVEPCATYRYNDDGKLTAVNSTNRNELQYQYSGADLISSSGGASGNYTYEYDSAHNITKATNGGLSQSMTYDSAGLVTSTTLKGSGSDAYLKTNATYTADGSKVGTVTDTLGNTATYQYSDSGNRTSVNTAVSDTKQDSPITPKTGHFTNYSPSATYRQEGWDVYTNWDNNYFYVRFEAEQLISEQTRYLDWYFDNNGIHYRIYACWNEDYETTCWLWFGRDDYGATSYDVSAVACLIDTEEGYAEFKVNRNAGEGIDENDRLYLNRAYVWSGSWQMLDYASINRTVHVSSYTTSADTSGIGSVTTHTVTDDAGRTTQTYINGIASVNYEYSGGNLSSISRTGYYNGGSTSFKGAFTEYKQESLVYQANNWKVYVQGGQDGYTYVRFENPNLFAAETRYLDWYFDNDGVEYRMYARWELETHSNYELWFGRDKTGEIFDYKSTEYAVDVKNGFAEFRLDPAIGGIRTQGGFNNFGGMKLNRAYVWSPTWQMLDSQVFDSNIYFCYTNEDSVTGKKTQEYSFTYDLFGNRLQTKVGNNTLITNEYDNYTTLTSSAYGNGYAVVYTYDELERVKTKEDPCWTEQYAYDKNGNISWMQVTSNFDNKVVRTVTYEYDTLGRLIYSVETDEDGRALRYVRNEYNSKNQLTAYSFYNGKYTQRYTYTYNADGSIETYRVKDCALITNVYDSLKRISTKTIADRGDINYLITIQPEYLAGEETNQTTALIDKLHYTYANDSGTSEGTVRKYDYMYEYDNVGNITRAYYNTAGADGVYTDHEVGKYIYDKQNQLIMEEVYNDGSPYTLIYNYDTYGNIREVEKYQNIGYISVEEAHEYGTCLGIDSYGYTDSSWRDLLTSYNGYQFTYDGIGNPNTYHNSKGTYYMGWDGRKLTSVSVNSTDCSYSYDSSGQRTGKTVGNAEYAYLYEGDRLVRMDYVSLYGCNIFPFYDDDGNPLGFYLLDYDTHWTNATRGVAYYYVRNAQGDVVQIRTRYNETVANYHYDAWGKLLSVTDANGNVLTEPTDYSEPIGANIAFLNPIRYRGYVYDNETGFYYLNSRYYDPANRRFINEDGYVSTGQGLAGYNMFTYCGNNPVMLCDCQGNCPHEGNQIYNPDCIRCRSHGEYFVPSYNGGAVNILRTPPPTKISNNCVQFIASYERFSETPYDDGIGNWTIGYGHLIDGPNYPSITHQEALALLAKDVSIWEQSVANYSASMSIVWDQNQFDALVSVAFNSGNGYKQIINKLLGGNDPISAFTWHYTREKAAIGNDADLGLWRRRMDEAFTFINGANIRTYRNP